MWPPPFFYIFLRGIDASFDRGEGKGDLGAREGMEEGAESTNKMNADRRKVCGKEVESRKNSHDKGE